MPGQTAHSKYAMPVTSYNLFAILLKQVGARTGIEVKVRSSDFAKALQNSGLISGQVHLLCPRAHSIIA